MNLELVMPLEALVPTEVTLGAEPESEKKREDFTVLTVKIFRFFQRCFSEESISSEVSVLPSLS
jgi:hypothetical protein